MASKIYEIEYVTSRNKIIPISVRLSFTLDEEGQLNGMWGVIRDLTYQYKISSELDNKEKFIEEVKAITKLGVFKHNFDTNDHWWSDELFSILKLDKNIFQPSLDKFLNRVHPDDKATVAKAVESFKHHKESIELSYRMVADSGDTIYGKAKWLPTFDINGELEYIEGAYYDTSEMINKENQLLHFRKRNQYFSENSFDGILFYDQHGYIINANKTIEKILEFKPHEIIGKHKHDLVHPDDRYETQLNFEKILNQPGNSIEFEQKLLHKNGTPVSVLTVISNLLNDKHINAVVSNFKDITDQRLAEDNLLKNEAHLRSLMESAVGFAVFRMKFENLEDLETGEVIFVSPSIKPLLFINDPKDIKAWLRDRPNEYRSNVLDQLRIQLIELKHGNRIIEKEDPNTGCLKYLQFVSVPIKENDTYFLNGMLIDITDQKRNEIAIQLSEEKYRLLANNMSDVVFTYSADYNLTYISPSSSGFLGYEYEEIKSKRFDELFTQKSVQKIKSFFAVRKIEIEQNQHNTAPEVLDLEFVNKRGQFNFVEISMRNVYKPDKSFHFTLGIMRNVTNQKNAQKALKNREQLFNSILEQSPFSVLMSDKNGSIYYANQSTCKSFGYPVEELLNMNMSDLDKQFGERKGRESKFFSEFPKETNVRYEAEIIHQKGKIIPVSNTIRVIEMNGEEFLLMYYEDLSDKKHAENAILQRDELFYSMLESSPFMVFLLNDKGQIGYANQKACLSLGQDSEELLGTSVTQIGIGLKDQDVSETILSTVSPENSIVIETSHHRKDGSSFPVKTDISKFYLDGYAYYLIFAQNISERIAAEKEIKIKDRAFESIHNAIIITDPNQENNPIIYCNDAFGKITLYEREEVIGQNIDFLFGDDNDQPEINVLKNVMNTLQSVELTLRSYKKDGTLFYNRYSISPVLNDNGELINYIGIIYDVTQQREIRQALRESEIKYRSLFEISADSLILIDTSSLKIIEVNEAACKTYGYNRYEFLKLSALDISANRDLTEKTIRTKQDGDKVNILHQHHIRKTEEVFPCDISASFSTIDDRLVVVISVKDISERINYIEKIKASERRYSQASLISKSGVWEMEPTNNKISYDENLERLFGYGKNEMNPDSEHWFDHVHIEDRTVVRSYMDDLLAGKTDVIEYEHRIIKKDGSEAWIFVKCVKISEEDEPIRVLGTSIDVTEKKRTQLKEKEQKNILESVLQSMVEGVIMINKKGEFELFNDSARKILGRGPSSSDMVDWPEEYGIYKPDAKELIPFNELPLVKALKGEKINGEELCIRNEFKNHDVYALTSASPIYRPDGSIYGSVVIFTDITERKLYVDQLRTTEGRYLQAAKLGKLATFEIQPNKDRFIYDDSLRNLLGYDYGNYKSSLRKWLQNVPDEDRDIILSVIQKYKKGENSESRIIHRIKRKDGAIRWIEVRSRYINYNDNYKIIGTIIDITEQKEAGDEIIKREELLNETGKLAKVGGWELDVLSNKLQWSNQTYRIYDLKTTERVTLHGMIQFCKEEYVERFSESIESAIQNQDIVQVEAEITTERGREKWIKLIGKPIVIKGTVTRLVGAIQDITSQKLSEEELILSKERAEESDRLKSTFLTTMSHELRTPLNAVIGFSEIIDDSLPKEDIIEFSKQINVSGNHLLNIIEDIFEISLIESGEAKVRKGEFDLNQLLDEEFQLMLNEKQKLNKHEIDLKLIKTSSDEKLVIYTDSSRYKQILTNLIKNALKFTHEGHVEFGYYIKDGHIVTVVKDTGIGIAKDQQEIIYERFRQIEDSNTREYGGTGLGLYICKKIVELMHGEIWLESFPGKGSSFYFSLPINNYHKVEQPVAAKDNNQIIDMSVFRSKELLIVEDEESNYLLLERILSKTPIEINWVKNGKDAVHYCSSEDVDIVLMDIQLPKLNGYEATKLIKNIKPDLPIIAQTAYAMSGDREKALEAGCDDYLSKPINRSELYRVLHKYLNKKV